MSPPVAGGFFTTSATWKAHQRVLRKFSLKPWRLSLRTWCFCWVLRDQWALASWRRRWKQRGCMDSQDRAWQGWSISRRPSLAVAWVQDVSGARWCQAKTTLGLWQVPSLPLKCQLPRDFWRGATCSDFSFWKIILAAMWRMIWIKARGTLGDTLEVVDCVYW